MRTSGTLMVGVLVTTLVFVGGVGCKKADCSTYTGCPFHSVYTFQYICSGFRDSARVGDNGYAEYPYDRGCSSKSCAITPIAPVCDLRQLFFASPFSINLQSPPASGSISGSGISAAYGMPIIEYRDYGDAIIGQTTATEVAADGSWLSGPVPDLSAAYTGTYLLWVSNRNADGSHSVIGVAEVQASGRDYPPPQDETCPCGEQPPCRPCIITY